MKPFARFAIVIASLSLFVMPVQAGPRDSKTDYAYRVLQPYVESGQLSGAISVFYKDGVQETCCAGYADVSKKRRIRMDNVFMQCSQTKGFCGVTIAKLVEEGRISLDDPVSKYLPEFGELWVLDSEKDGIKTLHKAGNAGRGTGQPSGALRHRRPPDSHRRRGSGHRPSGSHPRRPYLHRRWTGCRTGGAQGGSARKQGAIH